MTQTGAGHGVIPRWRRGRAVVAAGAVLLVLTACGGDGAAGEGEVLTGTLRGDAVLEGGCAWLETDDGSYEVRWPEGYAVELDPVRLIGPDGAAVAVAGDEVSVRGRTPDGVVTICQVGEVFEADEVLSGSA